MVCSGSSAGDRHRSIRRLMVGLWAEVSAEAFKRIIELWTEPDQDREAPFRGHLANVIPSYPDTLGLPVSVQLTGAKSRPAFVSRARPNTLRPGVRSWRERPPSIGMESTDRKR